MNDEDKNYLMITYKLQSLSRVTTSTCGSAYLAAVAPQATFEKCAAYFSKEAKSALEQVRSPAGCGGGRFNFKSATRL